MLVERLEFAAIISTNRRDPPDYITNGDISNFRGRGFEYLS